MKTVEMLTSEALLLPVEQRMTLAHNLLASVDAADDPQIQKAWDDEIERRIGEYDSGNFPEIPGTQAFAELDKRLSRK
jgi:putative addiction module component (TIGR02574 family)